MTPYSLFLRLKFVAANFVSTASVPRSVTSAVTNVGENR